jgi:hypothetical protein
MASDPLFVNTSGGFDQLMDFKLAPNSPCVKKGRNKQEPIGADIDKIIRVKGK